MDYGLGHSLSLSPGMNGVGTGPARDRATAKVDLGVSLAAMAAITAFSWPGKFTKSTYL